MNQNALGRIRIAGEGQQILFAARTNWIATRAAQTSVARLAVIPAQDLLGLGSAARMNTPARGGGNWTWRLAPGQLDGALARKLRRLTTLAGRLAEPPAAAGGKSEVTDAP